MTSEEVETACEGGVLTVTFNRPKQRNAMTWGMYDALAQACDRADSDDSVRVLVLRGAGGRAFVAGTDITQFAEFTTGQDGVDYERRVTAVLDRLDAVTVPTIASIDGYCVGGGLGIACAVDLRIATPRSTFGVPIARTLGNCLSETALRLLLRHFGHARTLSMLLTARMMTAEEAHATGFLAVLTYDLRRETRSVVDAMLGHAPLSMWASKEALRRMHRDGHEADLTDIIARVYGSADFRSAVNGFKTRKPVRWNGN